MRTARGRFAREAAGTLAAAFYATVAIPRFRAGAAEFSYKLGMDTYPADQRTVLATQVAAKIGEETGGRLEITVYPNDALGTDAAMISQLRLGALELLMTGNGQLSGVVPAAGICAVDFVFTSAKEAWAVADGALGDYVRRALSRAGMYPLQRTMWDSGFKQIASNRPIFTPDDLKGLRLGIQPDKVQVAVFKALGAAPVPSFGPQFYMMLQTHLLDGVEAGFSTLDSGHFSEVAMHIAVTNHLWQAQNLLANPAAWQRLPKNLREVAERNFNAIVPIERNMIINGDATLAEKLRTKNGMTIAKVDFAAFAAVIQKAGFFAQWRESYGPEAWGLLEKALGRQIS